MGGRCYFFDNDGPREANEFTDNFQIVKNKFKSYDLEWFSVEQAFQALKLGPKGREMIHSEEPNGMNEGQYGNHVWHLGSKNGDYNMRDNWDLEKIKVMFILNIEKYIAYPHALVDLVELTGRKKLIGLQSTYSNRHKKYWDFWNGAIQTKIRDQGDIGNLKELLEDVSKMNNLEVEEYLLESYE
jgi:hypothetical protein